MIFGILHWLLHWLHKGYALHFFNAMRERLVLKSKSLSNKPLFHLLEGEKCTKKAKKEKLIFIKILCFHFIYSMTFNYYELFRKSPWLRIDPVVVFLRVFWGFFLSSSLRCTILELKRGLELLSNWQMFCPFKSLKLDYDEESAFFRVTVV